MQEHVLGICCHLMLTGSGGVDWDGLAMCHLNPEWHKNLFETALFKVPTFPQPKRTTANMGKINKLKCISNLLIINYVQLASGVLCAAVWSPWRHHQHHSGELMSSGCVLSADSAASLRSSSGPGFLGGTPASEDFLPFPAGSQWNAQSAPLTLSKALCPRGCVNMELRRLLPHARFLGTCLSLSGWCRSPHLSHKATISISQNTFKRVTSSSLWGGL